MNARRAVVIVGGGAIGCSIARELAGRGVSVTVIERAEPGAEASGAAAGLIAPQAEGLPPGPLFDLAVASRALYPELAAELARETEIDVAWRRQGVLRCAMSASAGNDDLRFGWQRQAGLAVEPAGPARIAEISGGMVSPEAVSGLFFPDDGTVDPRRLTRALWTSAERRGVRFLLGTPARRIRVVSGRCCGVETDRGALEAGAVVDATGAWSAFDPEAPPVPVEPVRGQIVELRPAAAPPCVVESEEVYLLPREDGSVLVGSTEERVGFLKEITAAALRDLVAAACRLVPSLETARFAGAWAGLRPGSSDGLPILGESSVSGLFFATGHFRNGILLAPVTGRLVAAAVLGDPPPALDAFSPNRFSGAERRRTETRAERLFG